MASLGKQISDFFNGGSSANDEGLRGLLISELQALYYAEREAVDALGEQADAATTDVVRNAFLQHQEESRNQITRLERVFDSLGVDVEDKESDAMDGLVDDARTMISETESGSLTRDAALIIAAQKVEHLEIAGYGSAHSLARLLGYHEAAQLLEQTLQEEKNTDKKLTEIAESFINERAKAEGHGDHDSFDNDNDMDRDRGTFAGATTGAAAGAGAAFGSTFGNDANSGSYGSDSNMNRDTFGNDSDMNRGTFGNDSDMNRGSYSDNDSGRTSQGTGSSSYSGTFTDDDDDMEKNRNRDRGSYGSGTSNDPTIGGMTGV